MSYNNPWIFNGIPFEPDSVNQYEGFVYLIESLIDGRKYIGRKYFHTMRKGTGKRRSKKESDWRRYWSSSEEVKRLIALHGVENFRRTILSLHTTKGDCNIEEVKQQFLHNVLEHDGYLNENINGKWRKRPLAIINQRVLNEEYYGKKESNDN